MAGRSRPRITGRALAGMAILCAAFISAMYVLRDNTFATGPAEQRTVELSDGTQVSLNANSRVVVQYDDRVRKVTLTSGEALFNVTKHQPRPFVVVIGDRKVIAMGTSFVVRREESAVTEADLRRFCSESLPHFKLPATITFVDALPRNEAGKVLRAELAARHARGAPRKEKEGP